MNSKSTIIRTKRSYTVISGRAPLVTRKPKGALPYDGSNKLSNFENLTLNLPIISREQCKKPLPKMRAIYMIRRQLTNTTNIKKQYFPSINGPVWLSKPNLRLLKFRNPSASIPSYNMKFLGRI